MHILTMSCVVALNPLTKQYQLIWGVLVFLILLKILVSARYCGVCAR